MTDPTDQTQTPCAPVPAPRRGHYWLVRPLWMLGVVFVLFGITLGTLKWAIGRDLTAPPWLQAEVEARINAQTGGTGVRLGAIVLRIEDGLHPRLTLRDVDLMQEDGRPLVSFAHVETGLAIAPMLRGQVQPRSLRVSGVGLRLRRLADGSFDLALGEALTPVGTAGNLGQLIEGLDRALVRPGLSALRRIEADAVTLRYDDARIGRGWTVDGGRMSLDRADGSLRLRADFALLGGGDTVTTLDASYESVIGARAATFGVTVTDMPAQDIAVHSPALAWLNALRAPISGALRVAVDDQGALGPLSASLSIGAGVLQPTDQTRPIPFDSARAYLTYAPDSQTIRFDDLTFASKWVSARAEGSSTLIGLDGGAWPREFIGQFTLSEISANPNGLYPAPVRFEAVDADMRLRLDPFRLDIGQVVLRDAGQVLQATGAVRATPEGWAVSLGAAMDGVTLARVLQLWPQDAVPRTRDWIAQNVHTADLRNVEFGLRLLPGQRPETYLGLDFSDAEVTVLRDFPPLTGVAGRAVLEGPRFAVLADRGRMAAPRGGVIDAGGTSFVIPDVLVPFSPAEITLSTRSTVTAALSLIDLPPFRFLTKAGQPVTLADGRAEVSGRIALPLKRDVPLQEVDIDLRAVAMDLRSDVIVPGRVLTAPRADVRVTRDLLRVAGKGRLGQVPVDAVFETPLAQGQSGAQVTGSVVLSQVFADEFNIGLPAGSLTGQGAGTFRIDLPKGAAPRFRLTSDLRGLGMRLVPLGWSIAPATRGTLDVAGALATPPVIDRIALDAPGLSATGSVTLRPDGQLDRAAFERVRAGGWLDAPVVLTGRGRNAQPAVAITGGSVDLRRTSVTAGGGGTQGGGPLSLALDRLQISDGIALTRFRGEFSTAKGMDGRFTGLVNGAAPVTGRVAPRDGRSAFRLLSEDAGAVFSAAGLLKKAHKGALDLTLLPAGGAGSYDGTLKVEKVWLREAPAMAELLNAVSIVGLLDQLGGSGILFSEVEADFRLTPDRAIVRRASATGASLGISMDGYYDLNSGQMDMQGVFSPIFMLNGIGSVLTRKGEGLLGFNYRLTGTGESPRVQVNPLSILTPGMFREIFRRPAPRVTQ